MKLVVIHDFSAPAQGVNWYHIVNADEYQDEETPESLAKIESLMPRIKTMAKRVLGDDLKDMRMDSDRGIHLCVSIGIAKGEKRSAWQELLGWIALHTLLDDRS